MLKYEEAKDWLEEAGKIAMAYFGKVEPSFKDNKSYVTEADLKVQRFLKEKFDFHYPDFGVLAEEENLFKEPQDGKPYFVVDPIDGTASFVLGLPIWGIALGVIVDGQAVAGYFYMPATEDFYYTDVSGPVYRNGSETQMKPFEEVHNETMMLAISSVRKKLRISPNYPGKVLGLGSSIAHLCYLSTGSADAALVSGGGAWDIAAGAAMLYRNGGVARYINGEEVTFSKELIAKRKLLMPVIYGKEESIEYFLKHISLR